MVQFGIFLDWNKGFRITGFDQFIRSVCIMDPADILPDFRLERTEIDRYMFY